jgi:ApbE superfamily uncharacterized protein (UPF0280 family)
VTRQRPNERTYRRLMRADRLTAFRVVVKETDLWIQATRDLSAEAREAVIQHRQVLESYIAAHPGFASALTPWQDSGPLPALVRRMIDAGTASGVGPMAAVAGAIAQAVGDDLLTRSEAVIVENGGDVYVAAPNVVTAVIYAGSSPLSMKIGLAIDGKNSPTAMCTSSGTVGHSMSMGKADAVCVLAADAALADAAATAIANRIRRPGDVRPAITSGSAIAGIDGIVAILGEEMGAWGEVTLVPVEGKKVAF